MVSKIKIFTMKEREEMSVNYNLQETSLNLQIL